MLIMLSVFFDMLSVLSVVWPDTMAAVVAVRLTHAESTYLDVVVLLC